MRWSWRRERVSRPISTYPHRPKAGIAQWSFWVTLAQPTQAVLKSLLASGYSADERAALLSVRPRQVGIWPGVPWLRKIQENPRVIHVLERLLSWFALAQQFSEPKDELPAIEGIERMDQPLQVILTARERGTRLTSPLAFVLPEGVSTMKSPDGISRTRLSSRAAAC